MLFVAGCEIIHIALHGVIVAAEQFVSPVN